MGTLEQTKVIQAVNRLESIRRLLNEVSLKDGKYKDRFSVSVKIYENLERNWKKYPKK